MNCPKCRIEVMKQETYQDVQIDRCPACKGMYFDRGELNAMIAKKMGNTADTLSFSAMSDGMDEVKAVCTRCNKDMSVMVGPADMRFEMCKSCGGIFLDQGEFATFQLYYP